MASRFWVGGTGTWDNSTTTHWAATSNGAGGQSVPGSGDTVTFDGFSGGGTVTPNYNMTVTSITMGAFTGTLDFSANNNSPTMTTFSGTGTGVRTLNMGSGTWTITGSGTTIWNCNTLTNATISIGTITCNYSGGTGTRTIVHGATGGTEANAVNLKITAGTDTISLTGASKLVDVDFTGFTGTFSINGFTIYGNLTLNSGMTAAGGFSVVFSGSDDKTITSNGVNLDAPVTINTSHIVTLNDNLSIGTATARNLTLTSGTLDLDGNTLTHFGNLSVGGGSTTRVLAFGTDGIYKNTNTNTATVVNYSGSNFSTSGTGEIQIFGNTANTITFAGGGATYPDLICTNTNASGTLSITGANTFNILSLEGNNTTTLSANITLTGEFYQENGTFNANGYNVTATDYYFLSDIGFTPTVNMGSGTWLSNGEAVGWYLVESNGVTVTINPGTSTIKFNVDNATQNPVFAGEFSAGGKTYNNLWITGGASQGVGTTPVLDIFESNTFNDIKCDLQDSGFEFEAGETTTTNTLTISGGTIGHLTLLASYSTPSTWSLVKIGGGISSNDYLSITDSIATPSNTWYAGSHSTNGGNNTGWIFSTPGQSFFSLI